jgi:hypothetical protein
MSQLASAPVAEQLELPLASTAPHAACPVPPAPTGDESLADWSPEEALALHGLVLERNLKVLSCRSKAEEKQDVLRWIFRPDVTYISVQGRRLTQHQDDVPFSFRRCCRLAGYDADELRDALRTLLERRGIEVPGA